MTSHSRNHKRIGRPPVRLGLEMLEVRWCPAVSVLQVGTELSIVGNRADNDMAIVARVDDSRVDDPPVTAIQVVADGIDFGAFRGVTRIRLNTGAGDDSVRYEAEGLTSMPPDFQADLSSGHDTLTLEYRNMNLTARHSVNVVGGSGDDETSINLSNVDVNAAVTLSLGGGTGADEVGIIIVGGKVGDGATLSASANGGGGGDEVGIIIQDGIVGDGATLSASANGGGGGDEVGIVIIGGSVGVGATLSASATGDGGDDEVGIIVIGGSVARDASLMLSARGGAGHDDIRAQVMFDPQPEPPGLAAMLMLDVRGDAGNDNIRATSDVSFDTHRIDGGTGLDLAYLTVGLLPTIGIEETIIVEA